MSTLQGCDRLVEGIAFGDEVRIMNKLLITFCLALTVAACASTPKTAPTPAPLASNASILNNCAPLNPSAPQTACTNQNASSYGQQTWQQRGATNTADALRQTSPSLSVR
jgi:hypothetical protein